MTGDRPTQHDRLGSTMLDAALTGTSGAGDVGTRLFFAAAEYAAAEERARAEQHHTAADATDSGGPDASSRPGEDSDVTPAWFDPDSHEGQLILRLVRRVTALHRTSPESGVPAGSIGAADRAVVVELQAWLASLGIDGGEDPDAVACRMRRQPHRWTGFGLRGNDAEGETLIAAVVSGDVASHNAGHGSGAYQRVAESVYAATAAEAEAALYERLDRARRGDAEDTVDGDEGD